MVVECAHFTRPPTGWKAAAFATRAAILAAVPAHAEIAANDRDVCRAGRFGCESTRRPIDTSPERPRRVQAGLAR
jgi:hypothetical protein